MILREGHLEIYLGLIRAQRKLLEKLTPIERKDEMAIIAKIGFANR